VEDEELENTNLKELRGAKQLDKLSIQEINEANYPSNLNLDNDLEVKSVEDNDQINKINLDSPS